MSNRPKLTYIVTTYDRPERLPCVLWSLIAQTDPYFTAVVADNSSDLDAHNINLATVRRLGNRFLYKVGDHRSGQPGDEYRVTNDTVLEYGGWVSGEFLCFPSDDSYYVPTFGATMLRAAMSNGWDFVYCNVLYDPRWQGEYAVMTQQPKTGCIDKTGFIVRRSAFAAVGGFSDLPLVSIPGRERSSCPADGSLAERLVAAGVRHGHVPECLVVHN